jgi:hypothetical protein
MMIHEAAVFGHKRAGFRRIVRHAQKNLGEIIGRAHDDIHILIQKGIRSHLQRLLQSQNIVRIQVQVQVLAAPVKACHLLMATEAKGVVIPDPNPGQLFYFVDINVFHYFWVQSSTFSVQGFDGLDRYDRLDGLDSWDLFGGQNSGIRV